MAPKNRLVRWLAGSSVVSEFWGKHLKNFMSFLPTSALLLVFIHVVGVIIESFIHRENLVSAMINGRKTKTIDQK